MIRIAVVDDHATVREGLTRLIEREPGMRVVGEAGSAQGLWDLLDRAQCDVLVLDIGLPDKDGLEVLQELKAHRCRAAVLVLSMYPEERFALRAFRNGARGYVTKSAAADELVTAIRKVSAGGRFVSERMTEELARSAGRAGESPVHTTLSDREYQVFLLLAQGTPSSQIAAQLHLSENTVQTHRRRIMNKLGVRNNVQLSLYATRYGLID